MARAPPPAGRGAPRRGGGTAGGDIAGLVISCFLTKLFTIHVFDFSSFLKEPPRGKKAELPSIALLHRCHSGSNLFSRFSLKLCTARISKALEVFIAAFYLCGIVTVSPAIQPMGTTRQIMGAFGGPPSAPALGLSHLGWNSSSWTKRKTVD